MLSKEIIQRIKHIEITMRRLLSSSFVGDYSSAHKGSGFEFDQIREYQFGDDVRFIDWKASARANKILVKQYIEERNRTVVLAVDISRSNFYSSCDDLKCNTIVQIAAVIALVADYGKDQSSLLLFSDKVEAFIPPAKGRKHTHEIMQKLFSYNPLNYSNTNIDMALEHLAKMKRRDAIIFLLSDFIAEISEKKLYPVAKENDLVAIRCLDKNETFLPNVGFITTKDLETGQMVILDTRKKVNKLNKFLEVRIERQNNLFKKYAIDCLQAVPGEEFISDIVKFFRRRIMY